MNKYEFTGETKVEYVNGEKVELHRIRTTKGVGTVDVGTLGGWIEKEENLSHADNAWVDGNAMVCGNAWVCDNAWVSGNARVCDDAEVAGNACVTGDARVCDNAWVYGIARVTGNAEVTDNARITRKNDIMVIGAIGSRYDYTTFYRDKDNGITVKCGCFCGKIDEFAQKVKETHGDTKHGQTYQKAIELAKLQIDLSEE